VEESDRFTRAADVIRDITAERLRYQVQDTVYVMEVAAPR